MVGPTDIPLIRIIDAWPETLRARVQDRTLLKLRRAMQVEYGTRADNTWLAREAALKTYGEYAAKNAFDILPASTTYLPQFLKDLRSHGRKLATIEAYVAHLREIHTLAGLKEEDNPLNKRQVMAILEQLRRENTEAQKQDVPIRLTGDDTDGELVLFEKLMAATYPRSEDDLKKEAAGLPSKASLTEERDKMILTVAISSGLRRDEIAAIDWPHLQLPRSPQQGSMGHNSGRTVEASVMVPRSKTDQHGKGSYRYLSPLAVRLLKVWKARYEPEGYPPFPKITKHGTLSRGPIGGRTVAEIFKRLSRAAGYEDFIVSRISGHSTRIGLAQEMAIDGKTLVQIMQSMDWKTSGMVLKYVRHLLVTDSGAKDTLDKIMS